MTERKIAVIVSNAQIWDTFINMEIRRPADKEKFFMVTRERNIRGQRFSNYFCYGPVHNNPDLQRLIDMVEAHLHG